MISLALAMELKRAGLVWRTATHDFFAIPDHDLDERVFVLADMVAFTELVQGWPAVAFHGAAEWALDYVFSDELVWLPTEEQLREALMDTIFKLSAVMPKEGGIGLTSTRDGYQCAIAIDSQHYLFKAPTAGEAYAAALLYALRQRTQANGV